MLLYNKSETISYLKYSINPTLKNIITFEFRKCGKAVCDGCSSKKSALPYKGHEIPVRVCEECYIGITEEE